MPMSSGGHAANSSGCATRPKAREIGSTDYAGPTQHSSPIGHYVMATAEHREPCDSRGSCTVLGAPGGEIPPGDSTTAVDSTGEFEWLGRVETGHCVFVRSSKTVGPADLIQLPLVSDEWFVACSQVGKKRAILASKFAGNLANVGQCKP